MPQALAAAIVAAIGITGTAAAIATAVITLALTVGLNFIANAIFGGSGVNKPSDGQRVVRVAVGSRIRHYGKVRIGGQLTFYESRDGTLYSLITTGQGQINLISEYLLNGKVVTVGSGGRVQDARFQNAVDIQSRTGGDDQTAYSQLSSVFTEWTSDHRQRGCSSILVVARGVDSENFAEVYEGNREPEPTVTVETSLVYDPRLDSTQQIGVDGVGSPIMGSGSHRKNNPSTFEYSDNWALCTADYLAHPDGFGMGWDMINWQNIAEEADVCDEAVVPRAGGTIPRWRVAGSYKLSDDERRAVIREFLKAGDGFIFQDASGLANLLCGRWVEPTLTIPEKHILGCTANLGADAQDRANEVRVVYMEPNADYTETEAAPLVDAAARAALGRPEVSRFDAYYAPHHNQAQRVGKRILARLGERWQLTITTNLYGLNAVGERFIRIGLSELSINDLAFEITSLTINPGDDETAPTVSLGLLEVRAEDFDFDAATEEGDPPVVGGSLVVPITVESVSNLALASVQITGGIAIKAAWDAPVRVGLVAQAQYRQGTSGDWLEMNVTQSSRVAVSSTVNSGEAHQVRVRYITISGRPGPWSDPLGSITPSITETPPSAPADFVATGAAGQADLSWRNPTEANFSYVRIFRNTVDDFGTAAQTGDDLTGALGAVQAVADDGLAADDYFYWLVAYSASNLNAGPTAVQQATVT